ncbi:MAG: GntR family transcriptional regulator [Streptosporangiales bacterium]|nr:GntR family transcriptional regulator [Streptosporangiales bacterium]
MSGDDRGKGDERGARVYRLVGVPDERPLHRQVRDRIREIALAQPLGQRTVIAPEPDLAAMMNVSRGTVRKAVDSLVAEGLLVREHGRGTFVDPGAQVRRVVSQRLNAVARPDSRFDDDFTAFVPDYEGSVACAERIAALPAYADAETIFVTRDNNLRPLRERALRDGKRLIAPSHGLRTGLRVVEKVPRGQERFAGTLDGIEEFAEIVELERLGEYGPVGVAIAGAVAVSRDGAMFGARIDYFQAEVTLLDACGALPEDAIVVGVVHDCQIIQPGPGATRPPAVLDLVVTPTMSFPGAEGLPRRTPPERIDRITWDAIPRMSELVSTR